jgi:hypothetical protein
MARICAAAAVPAMIGAPSEYRIWNFDGDEDDNVGEWEISLLILWSCIFLLAVEAGAMSAMAWAPPARMTDVSDGLGVNPSLPHPPSRPAVTAEAAVAIIIFLSADPLEELEETILS